MKKENYKWQSIWDESSISSPPDLNAFDVNVDDFKERVDISSLMKLSVNLNKIALLRNSRGNDSPSLQDYAKLAIKLGVDGLTLHPRPDHRHATSNDAKEISKICKDNNIEFN